MPANLIVHLKEMFAEMTIKKNPSVMAHYYHPDFLLYCNGEVTDYAHFHNMHEEIYKTPIQYKVEYDEETLVAQQNKVAGRIFITTSRPNETPTKIEVILIVEYKENKIYRLWELTFPDWTRLAAFEKVTQDNLRD